MAEGFKILCVDDEPNVLNALKRLFMDEDYTVLTAASGQDGLEILKKEDAVQVVISDYRMPGMNGVEFLKEVRNQWPDTVRIVLSGYADTAAIVSAINEGEIYRFIPKPWNDYELKVTIANALERFELYKKNIELTAELNKKNQELEKLNQELQKHLDFRSKALDVEQRIIDALPVGIMGVDLDGTIAMCNSAWIALTGSDWRILGQNVASNSCILPGNLKIFTDEVKNRKKYSKKFDINGMKGTLSGALMDYGEDQKGIFFILMPDSGDE
jgi:two-component system NtrC family sensor kinase